ncbi:MAG: hypothetical protein GY839_05720 [candidate division Zixibacteria bacterium]|nr:hypothetical protein [candidate division Zixibacteria bacterium]
MSILFTIFNRLYTSLRETLDTAVGVLTLVNVELLSHGQAFLRPNHVLEQK